MRRECDRMSWLCRSEGPTLYPTFHLFVCYCALLVRVFETALPHEVEGEFANNVVVRTIVRLALYDFGDVLFSSDHNLSAMIVEWRTGYNNVYADPMIMRRQASWYTWIGFARPRMSTWPIATAPTSFTCGM